MATTVTVREDEVNNLMMAVVGHPNFQKSLGETVKKTVEASMPKPDGRPPYGAAQFMKPSGSNAAFYLDQDGQMKTFPHSKNNGKMVGYREKMNPFTGQRESHGTFGSFLKSWFHLTHDSQHLGYTITNKERERCEEVLKAFGVERIYERDGVVYKTAMSESSGIAGGFTVPPMFSETLMTIAGEETLVDRFATKLPLTSKTLSVPSLDLTTVQGAGVSPFGGGVQAQWVAEAAIRAEFEPQFRSTELTAWELSFISIASNTLLQDEAVGLDQFLTQIFGWVIGWTKDYAFLQGNGVGKPLGILNSPATIQVAKEAASKFTWYDAVAMLSKIWSMLLGNKLCWFMHQSVFPQLMRMNDDSAGSQAGRVLWVPINQGAAAAIEHPDGPQSVGYLLGYPVYLTEKLPALGSTGSVLLADCSKYLVGERMELEIAVSDQYRFANNQLTWRMVARCDGQPWVNAPITLADGTYQVSPFSMIAA